MWNGAGLLILVVSLLSGPSVLAKKYNVSVGYLPCITGEASNRAGTTISGAILMALEEINNNTELLPDVKLVLRWNDTRCDTAIATRLMANMSRDGAVAFFGPEGRCQTEAVLAQSQNLPMISYKCSDYQISTLPNFVRLNPPETQATKSVLSLLRYYRWNKFSIIYDETWVTAAMSLKNYAENNNMTVNYERSFVDVFKCCVDAMPCCNPVFWYHLIQETKNRNRIYVFLGSTSSLQEMMTAMELLKLFENGEYMVIFVDMMAYSFKDSMKYLIKIEDINFQAVCPNTAVFRKRAQSLLVVVSSEPDSTYENFMTRVRKYNNKISSKFSQSIFALNKFIQFISINAAYLYDSVKLYATALHSLIEEDTTMKNETLTYEKLMTVATNGSRIVSKMINSTPFNSVTGMSIHLDKRGISMGNFSVLAFKPVNFSDGYMKCSYTMIPVGHFQQSAKEFPEFKLNLRLPIEWAESVKPEDEPPCGFINEKCSNFLSTSLVAAAALAVTFFSALFCFYIYCKKQKSPKPHNRRTKPLLVAN